MFTIDEKKAAPQADIRVLGIGGGGGNALETMIEKGVNGVRFIAVNTDAQALEESRAEVKIQLGAHLTKGLGAGANPEIGRRAAIESYEDIVQNIKGADMVFITAGMGGGTGTGGVSVAAEAARESGVLTVGVVTYPFQFEGRRRKLHADKGIALLKNHVDTLIIIANDKLLSLADDKTPLTETFKKTDDVLFQAVKGLAELISRKGLINLDFADVRTVMLNKGMALMSAGEGEGRDRAKIAVEQAVSSPLLEHASLKGATGVIVNITGGPDLTLSEAHQVTMLLTEEVDPDADIIVGAVIDESLKNSLKITVIATGFDENIKEKLSFAPSFKNDAEKLRPCSAEEKTPPAAVQEAEENPLPHLAGACEEQSAAPIEQQKPTAFQKAAADSDMEEAPPRQTASSQIPRADSDMKESIVSPLSMENPPPEPQTPQTESSPALLETPERHEKTVFSAHGTPPPENKESFETFRAPFAKPLSVEKEEGVSGSSIQDSIAEPSAAPLSVEKEEGVFGSCLDSIAAEKTEKNKETDCKNKAILSESPPNSPRSEEDSFPPASQDLDAKDPLPSLGAETASSDRITDALPAVPPEIPKAAAVSEDPGFKSEPPLSSAQSEISSPADPAAAHSEDPAFKAGDPSLEIPPQKTVSPPSIAEPSAAPLSVEKEEGGFGSCLDSEPEEKTSLTEHPEKNEKAALFTSSGEEPAFSQSENPTDAELSETGEDLSSSLPSSQDLEKESPPLSSSMEKNTESEGLAESFELSDASLEKDAPLSAPAAEDAASFLSPGKASDPSEKQTKEAEDASQSPSPLFTEKEEALKSAFIASEEEVDASDKDKKENALELSKKDEKKPSPREMLLSKVREYKKQQENIQQTAFSSEEEEGKSSEESRLFETEAEIAAEDIQRF